MLSNLLSNALKFSSRGSVVSIRAGFKPKKEPVTSDGTNTTALSPRRSSVQRIREVIVITGSIMNLLKNPIPITDSHRVNQASSPANGVIGGGLSIDGGQSIGGGLSVSKQPSPKGLAGRQIDNSFVCLFV